MIVLIDNYDSFSYNLYQMIGSMYAEVTVIRNDEITVAELEKMKPERIILSPGPGRPEKAGICEEVVRYFAGKVPILGVCLGHQAICHVYGGKITYAKVLMHGKQSRIVVDKKEKLFQGIHEKILAARYHSLVLEEESVPECLKVIARADDGYIMAVRHKKYEVYGVQFHPESVLTPEGKKILENFLGGNAK
jgi:anthranilate synthase component 2